MFRQTRAYYKISQQGQIEVGRSKQHWRTGGGLEEGRRTGGGLEEDGMKTGGLEAPAPGPGRCSRPHRQLQATRKLRSVERRIRALSRQLLENDALRAPLRALGAMRMSIAKCASCNRHRRASQTQGSGGEARAHAAGSRASAPARAAARASA